MTGITLAMPESQLHLRARAHSHDARSARKTSRGHDDQIEDVMSDLTRAPPQRTTLDGQQLALGSITPTYGAALHTLSADVTVGQVLVVLAAKTTAALAHGRSSAAGDAVAIAMPYAGHCASRSHCRARIGHSVAHDHR